MSATKLFNKRLSELDLSIYALHKRTGYSISFPYLQKISRGEIKQVSVEKLRVIAKAFGDPIEVWLSAAGYLDGVESITMPKILSKKGVRRILEIVETVPEEKMDDFVRMIEIYARGIL